ncbi:MAG: calcium/sodium antiporter [Treponema sp.]|nr:calcium/sodium antiporter [Treponema sp.]
MDAQILDILGLLVFGFILLVKGADWFVEGAAGIADKLGVPQLIIGLTIVAMGTSAPETAISLTATMHGSADLAVGNIIGSNIINVLVILGITAIITPLAVQKCTMRYEMPFVIVISVIFMLLGLGTGVLKGLSAPDGVLSRSCGIILLILFVAYLAYLFVMVKRGEAEAEEVPDGKNTSWIKLIFLLLVGLALVVLGSNYTINSATKLARLFGISERIIGLTIVALGTSLPELATCIAAALKKNADIAIGNIVGSNIFNMLFVGGVSATIRNLPYQGGFFADSIVCILTAVLLLLCVVLTKKKTLNRAGGIIMLCAYAGYFVYLIK